jgi:hypothetical protein
MARKSTSTFPLRFKDEGTHRLLRLLADQRGEPMTVVAEELISEGLATRLEELEQELVETAAALRSYRAPRRGSAHRQFAEAEARLPDPLKANRVLRTDSRIKD